MTTSSDLTVQQNPFEQAIALYAGNTPLMVRELWGPYLDGNQGKGQPDKWQDDVMKDFDSAYRGIAVRSCYGAGKTTVAAWCVWQQALFTFPQRTVVTSASGTQLWAALWNEILVWYKRLPATWQELFTVKADRIELKAAAEDSWIEARTCRAETPEALQGVHCEGGRVLLVADEGSAVPDVVYDSGNSSMSGKNCTSLLISNPTRRTGFFYRIFTTPDLKKLWRTYHVSAHNSSRVTPDFIASVEADGGKDTNKYRVQVLGEFPTQQSDPFIPFALIDAAMHRDISPTPGDPVFWGLDVGLGGKGDRCVICKRQGRVVFEPPKVLKPSEPDTMLIVGLVKKEWDDTIPSARPTDICIDSIGIGHGVADRLRELNLPVVSVNVAETPSVADDRFYRVRDQLWGAAKEWLSSRNVKLPDDEDLKNELAQIGCDYRNGNEQQVWPKAKMRQEMGCSPDLSDAFCLTFFTDAASVLYHANTNRSAWKEPLRRHLKGVV